VKELDETANRLMQTHPDQAQSIYDHQKEINESWNALTTMVCTALSQEAIFPNTQMLDPFASTQIENI